MNKIYGVDDKNIVWNPTTRGATVTYNGITRTFYGSINSDGKMIVDDQLLLMVFGAPSSSVAFLTTILYTVSSNVVNAPTITQLTEHDRYLYDPQAKTISATSKVTAEKLRTIEKDYNDLMSIGMMSGGLKLDIKQIGQIGKQLGLNVKQMELFKQEVEYLKQSVGKKANDNFIWQKLVEIAQEIKANFPGGR
jgi:hypothetical protein